MKKGESVLGDSVPNDSTLGYGLHVCSLKGRIDRLGLNRSHVLVLQIFHNSLDKVAMDAKFGKLPELDDLTVVSDIIDSSVHSVHSGISLCRIRARDVGDVV